MNKRKLITFVWSSIIFGCLISGVLASVAWFASANKFDVDITGSVVKEYFHTGDGSAEHPFVITRPIHYYHLVELFQRETPLDEDARFGTDYLYFQVGYDIDNDGDLEVYAYDDQGIYLGSEETPSYSTTLNMAYYSGDNALLPVGTNQVPFIGSFNGNADSGITIAYLNIHCAETVYVNEVETSRATSDVGIFGYVADEDAGETPAATVIQNLNVNHLTIDLSDLPNAVASSTTDVTHEDAHAQGVAHVGYVAGHVHTYTNRSVEAPANPNDDPVVTNASPLYNVYVADATIQGGPTGPNTKCSCSYGYIGLVDTVDGNAPTEIENEINIAHGNGQGQGNNWGGSVNFRDFNARIKTQLRNANAQTIQQNLASSASSTSTTYQRMRTYENSYLSASIYYGSAIMSNIVNKDPDQTRIIYNYLDEGTYNRSQGGTYVQVTGIPGTVQPLITAENDYYTPNVNNTGYIVGGVDNKTYATNAGYGMTVRTASYETRFIANAMGDTTYNTEHINSGTNNGKTNGTAISFPTYNKTKLEILTNSSTTYGASNYCYIKDELTGYNQNHSTNYNYTKNDNTTPTALKLTKYNDSRETLDSILSGTSYVHGLHFVGSSVTYNNNLTRSNLKILGVTKNNYKLPKNAIDFNLLEAGKINFFAGSYYSRGTPTTSSVYGSDSDNFFSLYHIVRSGDDLVSTSIKKISVIFENTDKSVDAKYVYQYSDNSNSAGTKGTRIFDLAYMDHSPVSNALYYFEIPVDKGEYALGAANTSASSYGGYLMYLDIGTSGEEQDPTHNQTIGILDATQFSQMDFQINSFVTNTCFNVAFVIPDGATKETFKVTISCGSVTHEGHTYVCYEIVILNTTENDFSINVLLMDDDDNPENDYYYMYAITYTTDIENSGTRTEYFNSDIFEDEGDGSLDPTYYQPPQQQGGGD